MYIYMYINMYQYIQTYMYICKHIYAEETDLLRLQQVAAAVHTNIKINIYMCIYIVFIYNTYT